MLSRWQSTIVDAQGNIQPFAILTVLNEETQALAQIYASESEEQPLPAGSVVADESGYAYFYAKGGRYRIQSDDLGIDWRSVPLGDLQGMDKEELGSAAFADIVGTMAGGAIIERGSNSNGEYVRFADGTQVCGGGRFVPNETDLGITSAGPLWRCDRGRVWIFPAVFNGDPTVAVTMIRDPSSFVRQIGEAYNITPAAMGVSFLTTTDSPGYAAEYLFSAIGRWK